MPHLNNSTVLGKHYEYIFQRDKNYLFYCSVFPVDFLFVSINENQSINSFSIFRQYEQQVLPPQRQIVLTTAYRLAREIKISNNFNNETEIARYVCYTSVCS